VLTGASEPQATAPAAPPAPAAASLAGQAGDERKRAHLKLVE
jgi:hypothetical protein